MITVPAGLRESSAQAFGDDGVMWCASLPDLVAEYPERWKLTLDLAEGAEPWFGFCGIVVPVRTDSGEQAVLKVSWPDDDTAHEHLALAAWAGNRAVQLLAADGPRRALLLERLDASRDLRALPVDDAIHVLVDLLLALAEKSAPAEIDTQTDLAARWIEQLPRRWREVNPPYPDTMLMRAVSAARELGPSSGRRLIHTDLHYENVLASLPENTARRGVWLAIDPKPIAGDPEFGVLPLLWNRLEELDPTDPGADLRRRMRLAAEVGGLDIDLVRDWSIARLAETIIWDSEIGTGEGDHHPGWTFEALTGGF
jgi:streptomycin 6-kinase